MKITEEKKNEERLISIQKGEIFKYKNTYYLKLSERIINTYANECRVINLTTYENYRMLENTFVEPVESELIIKNS